MQRIDNQRMVISDSFNLKPGIKIPYSNDFNSFLEKNGIEIIDDTISVSKEWRIRTFTPFLGYSSGIFYHCAVQDTERRNRIIISSNDMVVVPRFQKIGPTRNFSKNKNQLSIRVLDNKTISRFNPKREKADSTEIFEERLKILSQDKENVERMIDYLNIRVEKLLKRRYPDHENPYVYWE